jgi:hypothetical protein
MISREACVCFEAQGSESGHGAQLRACNQRGSTITIDAFAPRGAQNTMSGCVSGGVSGGVWVSGGMSE